MEENQLQEQSFAESIQEPEQSSENSSNQNETLQPNEKEGQSGDPSLILGKFKSAEDLTKAYQELQRLQGTQSAELGDLRKRSALMGQVKQAWDTLDKISYSEKTLRETSQKYSTYFEDPSFREMYSQAYLALGDNLDADLFVNLLEGYVSSRIYAHDKAKSAQAETTQALGGVKFDKNNTQTKVVTNKCIKDMSPKELDALLDELI